MSEPRGMLMVVLPSLQFPVPEALVVTRLMTQVLVAMLVGFGMGSGAPKRQPTRFPVQVPVGGHSTLLAHGAPARVPPTHALYSGSETVEEVQVRLVTPVSALVVAPSVSAPLTELHAVILVKDFPWSGTTEGSGVPTPEPPK